MKILKIAVILIALLSVDSFAQLSGLPGAFTRMGFNARGISMGNAMTSVSTGDLSGLYNPASSSLQNEHLINLSYSFLSLDRRLNFVSYTKNFKLPNQNEGGAGITFAWINAGVGKIDGRDLDGFSIGELSTSENMFLFAPSIRVSPQFSAGVGFKLYLSKLYEGIKSTSFGFDLGVMYKASDKLNFGLTIKDINSKYEWNTTEVYGQNGNQTKEKFPLLYTLGVSYNLPKEFGIVSVDYETSNKKSNIVRIGAEISPLKDIKFRAGVDRFNFSAEDKIGGSRPTIGLGYQKSFKSYIVGLDYSFVMEPYTHNPFQTLTAVIKFK
ncbi:MAG: hypothetical protein IT281_09260 [Ignavibacteria bacterium]|nr:hypothetical protein [Ignavibacteria bacterium]